MLQNLFKWKYHESDYNDVRSLIP